MDSFEVFFSTSAEGDLLRIAWYIRANDSVQRAYDVIQQIKMVCTTLSRFPHRGATVYEAQRDSYLNLRQLLCGVYRIIYEIENETDHKAVTIIAIVDSRRDLQQFLKERRLNRPT